MSDCMMFPETFDEFAEIFGFVDNKEYYTNGSELIPVFRVKQWLENESNRQKAEINVKRKLLDKAETEIKNQSENFKRLVAEHRKLQTDYSSMQSTLAKMSMGVEEAKAEAIKEFAERLKEKLDDCRTVHDYWYSGYDTADTLVAIDNLVKEMVGDTE